VRTRRDNCFCGWHHIPMCLFLVVIPVSTAHLLPAMAPICIFCIIDVEVLYFDCIFPTIMGRRKFTSELNRRTLDA